MVLGREELLLSLELETAFTWVNINIILLHNNYLPLVYPIYLSSHNLLPLIRGSPNSFFYCCSLLLLFSHISPIDQPLLKWYTNPGVCFFGASLFFCEVLHALIKINIKIVYAFFSDKLFSISLIHISLNKTQEYTGKILPPQPDIGHLLGETLIF